jgi:hypothetical protein
MRRIGYIDTRPPPQRREPRVGSSWPKAIKDETVNADIKHQAGLAQVEDSSVSTSDQIEFAAQQLIEIETLLTTLARSDPDSSRLMLPASKVWRAAKELEDFLRPRGRKVKRWWND